MSVDTNINDTSDVDLTNLPETVEDTTDGEKTPPVEPEVPSEDVKEPDLGSIDDINFDDTIEGAIFGDYDLSKFKDVLNLSDDKTVTYLTEQANVLKEQGFTQTQVEWLLSNEIEKIKNNTPNEKSMSDINKELNETLSLAEKKKYSAVRSSFKDAINGNEELSGFYEKTMSNPYMVKVLTAMHNYYTKSGKDPNILGKQSVEKRTKNISFDQALDEYNQLLRIPKSERGDGLKQIINKLSDEDKENFKRYYN